MFHALGESDKKTSLYVGYRHNFFQIFSIRRGVNPQMWMPQDVYPTLLLYPFPTIVLSSGALCHSYQISFSYFQKVPCTFKESSQSKAVV